MISPRVTDVTAPLLNIRAANPDVIVSTAYPGPAVLIAQKYGEFGMMKIPFAQAIQGIPVPAAFAKNVGNDAALANFYYGSPLNDLTDGPKQQKWLALYKQYYPDRTPSAFMAYGLPSAMAVTRALEKAGRNVTRESFIDALETAISTPGHRGRLVSERPPHAAAPRCSSVRREDPHADARRLSGTAKLACKARQVMLCRRFSSRGCQRHRHGCVYALIAVAGHRLQIERRHQFCRRRW